MVRPCRRGSPSHVGRAVPRRSRSVLQCVDLLSERCIFLRGQKKEDRGSLGYSCCRVSLPEKKSGLVTVSPWILRDKCHPASPLFDEGLGVVKYLHLVTCVGVDGKTCVGPCENGRLTIQSLNHFTHLTDALDECRLTYQTLDKRSQESCDVNA